MGDHTEAVSIDFDPSVTSYQKLLTYFWNSHRCDSTNSSTQYMNAVFYQNDAQKVLAEKSLAQQAKYLDMAVSDINTKILPVREFTYAESYHQKYRLKRGSDVRKFLEETYPTAKAMADSTVATRLNAYLGTGTSRSWRTFLKELPNYGLPEDLEAKVRTIAERKR